MYFSLSVLLYLSLEISSLPRASNSLTELYKPVNTTSYSAHVKSYLFYPILNLVRSVQTASANSAANIMLSFNLFVTNVREPINTFSNKNHYN